MKKNIIYLLIAGCSLFLGACNDDDTQYLPPVELQITSSTVDFKSVGGDGTIEVGNADPTLTATSNEEWCTIKACSNGVVSFYIAPNDEMETRTATISLVMGESSAKIGITQMVSLQTIRLTIFSLLPKTRLSNSLSVLKVKCR